MPSNTDGLIGSVLARSQNLVQVTSTLEDRVKALEEDIFGPSPDTPAPISVDTSGEDCLLAKLCHHHEVVQNNLSRVLNFLERL
jgi:hypothetical protein